METLRGKEKETDSIAASLIMKLLPCRGHLGFELGSLHFVRCAFCATLNIHIQAFV